MSKSPKSKIMSKKLDSGIIKFIKQNKAPFYGLLIFATIGTLLLIKSFAASTSLALQAESASLQGTATIGSNDSSASGSGGNYILFQNGSTNTIKCDISLHGKGAYGGSPYDYGDFKSLAPNGNAGSSWGGLEWIYWPDSTFNQIVNTINNEINSNGCTKVIIHGFSNGAAAAAAIYCKGQTFGGKLVGVIVDDPVMDNGVDNCSPGAGVKVKLYTTGSISYGPQACGPIDYTCSQGQLLGPSVYTSRIGVSATQSVNYTHSAYGNPPELSQWW